MGSPDLKIDVNDSDNKSKPKQLLSIDDSMDNTEEVKIEDQGNVLSPQSKDSLTEEKNNFYERLKDKDLFHWK